MHTTCVVFVPFLWVLALANGVDDAFPSRSHLKLDEVVRGVVEAKE